MKKYLIFAILSLLIALPSCVDTLPEEVIDYKEFYANTDDADNAILGLYGQFMELAGQVIILNELRADLMDVTDNATTDLQEINIGKPSKSNQWSNVSTFYKVIQTCNDIIYNFNSMLKDNRITQPEYDERYSDVAALRTWIYLQLGIHFGKVPYITEPIVAIDDLEKYKANELTLDQLIPELIRFMESLPTLENYQNSKLVQETLDGYSLQPFFMDKRCLLGDLYLFNDEYEKAAVTYRRVLATSEDLDATQNNVKYRLYTYVWTTGTPTWYQILYADGKTEDIGSLYNGWVNMFSATTTGRYTLNEMIWFLAYDSKYEPTYPFLELFNPVGFKGGKYLLKPSAYSVDSIWSGEVQKNQYPFDARGLTGAFEKYGNDYVIRKYSYASELGTDLRGHWWLYRAAMLHLRFAEAANRAGYPKLAWAFVNDGLAGSAFAFTKENGDSYPGDSVRISGYSPFEPYPAPYYFDARQNDQPYLRQPWRNNGGVRGRANLPNVNFPATCVTKQDSIHFVERQIISEAARELGFEGHRWEDLIRVARRMNKESAGSGNHFLWDENIRKKYERDGISGVDLSSEDKWFLPMYR
ncbi:MAG: hypothetical protein LBR64_07515 [Dysgonamonadaceae bacterium]|jgi:hypothetical protein|nr:hypothetical protein [Dysgonamonadaceae bacterium]